MKKETEERICTQCSNKFECYKGTTEICQKCAFKNAEAKAPLNAICEKCGRRYCDHEEKY